MRTYLCVCAYISEVVAHCPAQNTNIKNLQKWTYSIVILYSYRISPLCLDSSFIVVLDGLKTGQLEKYQNVGLDRRVQLGRLFFR
jgi:hypothetical protein